MSLNDVRERLSDLDAEVRRRALGELISAWRAGRVDCQPQRDLVNMHCHTFFSYNGYGHSPTSLAWLARERGWRALATVDFDVLDGVAETLGACQRVRVRAAAGLETRVFLPELASWEINSPGEPGILYYIGIGFTGEHPPASAGTVLGEMRHRAAERNRDMVARVNAYLAPVAIDYDGDVLPLTPCGNVTERHILIAYDLAARERFGQRGSLLEYWSGKLGMGVGAVAAFLGDEAFPHDEIRARLMKRGGVGYVQPGPDTFPPLDEVNRAIIACDAIPTYPFLDGLSEGEQRIEELLELLIGKGMAALTIIPDRNWNIPDPELRALKVRKLHEMMDTARSLDLPVVVGTEMNKAGQRLIDDFDAEPLRPLRRDFLRGADFVYGHTLMQQALGTGYHSDWARHSLPERGQRNAFYTRVGRLVEPGVEGLTRVGQLNASMDPDAIIARLESFQATGEEASHGSR